VPHIGRVRKSVLGMFTTWRALTIVGEVAMAVEVHIDYGPQLSHRFPPKLHATAATTHISTSSSCSFFNFIRDTL
jgi:hypothetical protein